jgi:hypothetical protein
MGIVQGPDKNLWIAEFGRNAITRFRPPAPPVVDARIQFNFGSVGSKTRFFQLAARDIPAGGSVEFRCSGQGCKKKKATIKNKRKIDLRPRLKRLVGPRVTIEVRVLAPGLTGFVRRFTLRPGHKTRQRELCLPPGKRKPVRCS